MRRLLNVIVTVSVLTTACDDRQPSMPSQPRSSATAKPQQTPHAEEPVIPSDVTYSIIDSSTIPGIKRMLDIRLNKKVSADTLRAIALRLKSQDSRSYERTFIGYYLPEMKVGAGGWATTHFNPNLEVRILGLTDEQEKALIQQIDDPLRELIGSWIDDRMGVGNRTTIFRRNGKIFMENTYPDGSSGQKIIVAKRSTKGKNFVNKEDNGLGEFYLIDSKGNLQLWDQDGLISTAKKIGG